MSSEFDLVHNHHEAAVFAAVLDLAPRFPALHDAQLLGDVACIALNRLPPRYVRHDVDFAFYLSDVERAANQRAVEEAVVSAFTFMLARQEAGQRGV